MPFALCLMPLQKILTLRSLKTKYARIETEHVVEHLNHALPSLPQGRHV
jgi:hypothetical protein